MGVGVDLLGLPNVFVVLWCVRVYVCMYVCMWLIK